MSVKRSSISSTENATCGRERRQRHELLAADRIASSGKATEAACCSASTGTSASSPRRTTSDSPDGHAIDDQLEHRALILRDGQPGKQQERDR